jgi:hypothetical protein
MHLSRIAFLGLLICVAGSALGADVQEVEGFDTIDFHHPQQFDGPTRDYRGKARGYMTASWWAPGQMKDNRVAWKTAPVPQKRDTTFVFVAATSVTPEEFTRGPKAELSVNGKEAVTFFLGAERDMVWKQGDYELRFTLKRLEFPYTGSQRQTEMNGISGLYELKVPAESIEAGKPAILQVEILPFEGWHNGWFMIKERRDALKQSLESLENEIESLRQDLAVVSQQAQTLASRVYPELSDPRDFKHEVIYRDGFRHLHPADLVKLKNGELLILAREAAEHFSNDGDVIMLRSKDAGATWGDKQVIAGIKDLDEREGCGIQLKDGTIVVGIYYNALYATDGSYKVLPATRPSAWGDADHPRLGCYIITSKDDGKTWSQPMYINPDGMPFHDLEGPTDAPIEMPDGSIIMGVIGYGIDHDDKNIGSVLLRSTDQGKSWKYLSTIAADPGGKLGKFVEPGLVRTKTGRILAALRNGGPDAAIWVAWSDDDGKTWTPAKKTEMIGHPTDLVQLTDGRILATYGVRTPHGKPQGIRACFSIDNGQTWDVAHEVRIRDDFMNWDIGYPESIELPDGHLLTVYYYNLFNKYFLGGTYWAP